MPIRKNNESRTPLGKFVRELRHLHGDLPQAEFQTEVLHYTKHKQYVNKIENGIAKGIDQEFILALERVSGWNAEQIKALADPEKRRIEALEDQTRHLLLFTHCVLAAPLALAAMQREIPAFRVGSFYTAKKSGPESHIIGEIGWIDKSDWLKVTLPVPGPQHIHPAKASDGRSSSSYGRGPAINAPVGATDPSPVRLTTSKPALTIPISSTEAISLLDRGIIDVAAVPGGVIRPHSRLVRVASMVDSASGCVLVYKQEKLNEVMANIRGREGSLVFADELAKAFCFRKLKIEVDEESLPYFFLKDGCVRGFPLYFEEQERIKAQEACELANRTNCKPGSIEWVQELKKSEKALLKGLPQDPKEMLSEITLIKPLSAARDFMPDPDSDAILTFQPRASWIEKSGGGGGRWVCEPVYLPFGPNGSPRHITFDIVIRENTATANDPRSRHIRRELIELINILSGKVELLNRIDTSEAAIDLAAVRLLAVYFALNDEMGQSPNQTVTKALTAVRYTAYVHPDFSAKALHFG